MEGMLPMAIAWMRVAVERDKVASEGAGQFDKSMEDVPASEFA